MDNHRESEVGVKRGLQAVANKCGETHVAARSIPF